MNRFYTRFLLLLAIGLLSFAAFAQDSTSRKLDPAFRYLLAKEKYKQPGVVSPPPPDKVIKPVEGYAFRGALKELRYECIIYTTSGKALRDSGLVINSILPKFVTGWLTLSQLEWVATFPQVSFIEAPTASELNNDMVTGASGAALLHAGKLNNTIYKGKGVIVAIYDTGIDWDHLDFRDPNDPTKSRILRLWDQTITANAVNGEAPPAGFSTGVEYTQEQLNDELDGAPTYSVRERDVNGHGTHVAGTAAGNGASLSSRKHAGMAPEADLVIIKGGNSSFPSSNTINAITYLKNLANTLGRPIVLNMSIGGQGGAHDGMEPHELAVDDFTASGAGRVVVIAAGNDNGNSHIRNVVAARQSSTINISVPSGTTGADVFRFSTFALSSDAIGVNVTSPAGDVVALSNGTAIGGSFSVGITNDIYTANGKRYVSIYVTRVGTNTANPQGVWGVTLTNNGATSMTFDGWISYRNASFGATTIVGGDNSNMVSSPGNATTAITTASYVGKLRWMSANGLTYTFNSPSQQDNISSFSNGGPRRDGLQKPEISAIGQAVISALSSDATSTDVTVTGLYQRMQGTSMASPAVAGAAALLLQANPGATATQVKNWLTAAGSSDDNTGLLPNARWGYGKLDVFKAVGSVLGCTATERKTYQYDNSFTSLTDGAGLLLGSTRIAVKFTPDVNGKMAGIFCNTFASIADIVAELRQNNGGVPGALLATQNVAASQLTVSAFNYIDLTAMNFAVSSGTDYFIVLYRNAANLLEWGARYDNATTANRSFNSLDGVSWTAQSYNWRIRPVVYSTPLEAGAIPAAAASDQRLVSASTIFVNSCRSIATLTPAGTSPVTGTTTAKLWIERVLPSYNGKPYAARHYDVVPQANAATATTTMTLYFTQAEFDAYNADTRTIADLPATGTDAAGKANLRVFRFSGVASSTDGLPASYGVSPVNINPADNDIVYNTAADRWEVTFETTGFGGFMVGTTSSVLPVVMEYFTGEHRNTGNQLRWKASCINTGDVQFVIERSATGSNFTAISTVQVTERQCQQPLEYLDATAQTGRNYYRLRMVEANGAVKYSSIVLLQTGTLVTTVNPTLLTKGAGLKVSFGSTQGRIVILDNIGRQVVSQNLSAGMQTLSLPMLTAGSYHYTVFDADGTQLLSGKLKVE